MILVLTDRAPNPATERLPRIRLSYHAGGGRRARKTEIVISSANTVGASEMSAYKGLPLEDLRRIQHFWRQAIGHDERQAIRQC